MLKVSKKYYYFPKIPKIRPKILKFRSCLFWTSIIVQLTNLVAKTVLNYFYNLGRVKTPFWQIKIGIKSNYCSIIHKIKVKYISLTLEVWNIRVANYFFYFSRRMIFHKVLSILIITISFSKQYKPFLLSSNSNFNLWWNILRQPIRLQSHQILQFERP